MRRLFSKFRLSISIRLALWFGLSFLLLLGIFVVFLYAGFHVSLHRDFQRQLESDLAGASDLVRIAGDSVMLQVDGPLTAGTYDVSGTGGTYLRLLSLEGDVVRRSVNFSENTFPPKIPADGASATMTHTWRGVPARTVYTPLRNTSGRTVAWLEVTRLESALHNELHRLEWLLALGVLLGAAVALGAGYYLARRALRPVAQITEASRRIQSEDIGRRLPTEFGVRDELTELAETLNALLARLSASIDRERRFRADAAHEMFTPLSAIQSEVDVTLRKNRSQADYKTALGAVREHTGRLKAIVEDLLELSRAEALETTPPATVDVSAVVAEVIRRYRARADERGVGIESCIDDGIALRVDPGDLQRVASNLLDNALKYTPEGGAITVSLKGSGREAVLSVSDTGAGFTAAERKHLFDRFYRTTEAAGGPVAGTGLGLSIVKAITEGYGGRIEGQSEGLGEGSRFTVVLPRTEPGATGGG